MDSVSREAFRSVTLCPSECHFSYYRPSGIRVRFKLIIDTGVTFNAKIRLYFWLCLGGKVVVRTLHRGSSRRGSTRSQ